MTRDKNGGLRKLLKKYEDDGAFHRAVADRLDAHAKILRTALEALEQPTQ